MNLYVEKCGNDNLNQKTKHSVTNRTHQVSHTYQNNANMAEKAALLTKNMGPEYNQAPRHNFKFTRTTEGKQHLKEQLGNTQENCLDCAKQSMS